MLVKPFKTGLKQTGMIKSGGRSRFLLLSPPLPPPTESALASCMHLFSQEVILLIFKCLQLKHLDIIKFGIRHYICILQPGAAHSTVCVISQSVLSLETCLHLAVTSQHSPAFHTLLSFGLVNLLGVLSFAPERLHRNLLQEEVENKEREQAEPE